MRAIWLLLTLAACVDASSQPCADGRVCPTGLRCAVVAEQPYCVKPDQIGCSDGQSCAEGSTCHENVCLPNQCGNDLVDVGEACDGGNSIDGDGCSATCQSTEVCGNNIVDAITGEQCDSGVPGLSGDGCASTCLVEGLAWNNITPQHIEARRDAAIAYDTVHGELVLFGGVSENTLHDDTWVLKPGGWKQRIPAHSPPARGGHAMAYDKNRGRMVLFGGAGSTYLNDTWELDGITWTQRMPATSSPEAREGAAVAYHDDLHVTLLVGGHRRDPITDAWTWDGNEWKKLANPVPPTGTPAPAVDSPIAAYDPVHHEIVLYTDYQTWTWNGTWTFKSRSTTMEQNYDAMSVDAAGRIVMVRGNPFETWVWSGSAWQKQLASTTLPASREATALALLPSTTPAQGRMVLFGGLDPSNPSVAFGDTWLWDAGTNSWSQVQENSVSPSPRAGQLFVYDALRGETVLFGGSSGNATLSDTWLWSDSGWDKPLPATVGPPPPSPRAFVSGAYDEKNRRVVMFGGTDSDAVFQQGTDNQETWTWDGASWTNATPGGASPSPRRFAAMVFDRHQQETVLFGGGSYGSLDSRAVLYGDTWVWNGSTWAKRTPAMSPSPRLGAAIAYDPFRERVVLFGGLVGGTASDPYDLKNDTWEWDGTTWRQVLVMNSPAQRAFMSMAYDPGRKRIVLVGGQTLAESFDDAWEWDGMAWRELSPQGSAGPRLSLVYDAVSQRLVSFGGPNYFGISGETWSLEYRSPAVTRERCILGDADDDGDGATGCADADCWTHCTPLCPPGIPCTGTEPRCGDGTCDKDLENASLCPADC